MKIEAKLQPTENVCKPFYISLPLIISYQDNAEEWPSSLSLTSKKIPLYKPPRIGESFQAAIPDLAEDTKISDIHNTGELVWRPHVLEDEQVTQFLKKAKHIFDSKNKNRYWTDRHREFFLTKLHIFKYDTSKCLLDLEESISHLKTPEDCWNTIEDTLFDSCHQPNIYHKDWHAMQAVIHTKNVSEIVDYYYWWKNKKVFSNYCIQDSKDVKQELMEQAVEDRDIPRLRRREKVLSGFSMENKKRALNSIVDDSQLPLYYDVSVTAGIDWDKVKQLEVKKRRLESPEDVHIGFPAMYHSHSENIHTTLDTNISHGTTPTHESLISHENDFHHDIVSPEKENVENDIDFQSWFSVNE